MNKIKCFTLKLKCHQYWPKKKKDNDKFIWNDAGVSVEFISKINYGFYVHSVLKYELTNFFHNYIKI